MKQLHAQLILSLQEELSRNQVWAVRDMQTNFSSMILEMKNSMVA